MAVPVTNLAVAVTWDIPNNSSMRFIINEREVITQQKQRYEFHTAVFAV